MATSQGHTLCPQCQYQRANTIYDSRTADLEIMCRSCGYHEETSNQYEDGGWSGSTRRIIEGYGALWFESGSLKIWQPIAAAVWQQTKLHLEQEMRSGRAGGSSYLTRWNADLKRVETVVGTFCEES